MCKNDEFYVKEMVLTWILTFPDRSLVGAVLLKTQNSIGEVKE